MNKYQKQFIKIEIKSCIKSIIQSSFLNLKIIKECNLKYKDRRHFNNNLFEDIMLDLDCFPEEFVEWLKKDVLSKLNTTSLIEWYLIKLSFLVFDEDKTTQQKYINAMKKLGLVKEIIFDEEQLSYNIITNNDKKYCVNQVINDNKKVALECNTNCHNVTEILLKELIDNPRSDFDTFGCCVLYYDIFNNPHYHSFVVWDKDDIVLDYAHNMKTNLKIYTDELSHEILLKEEASKVLEGIDTLKAIDSEFSKSNKCNFLKYVMNKQMKVKK